ncbi:MAG: DNA cytosine methyltransferase [Bacteroidales bacterium]
MNLLYIDLFAGAGGTSTGVETSKINGQQCAKVIACVNHDKNAIASHAANHPDALHFTEDIRTLELTGLVAHTQMMKIRYPDAALVLWASLECTNFSKAKGGLPRDADSRTLAEHLFRYIDALQPDYIHIENVEEFMSWGALDDNGKPLSRDNGNDYRRWVKNIKQCGYRYEYRILNAADFGAFTSRKRFFAQFARPDMPISWPEPTHSKNADQSLFSNTKKWRPVREVLDFTDEGESIFTRKKDLSEKTLERIYAGLIKFVAGGKSAFLSKYFSGRPEGKNITVDAPAGSITTIDHHSLISVNWMLKYNSINGKTGIHNPPSVDEPCPVISTQGRLGVVKCDFISAYYSNGDNCSSVESPSPTVTTKDRLSLIQPRFIDQQFGTGKATTVDKPIGAITTIPKYNIVTCTPWVMNTNFGNVGSSIDEPSQVITANRKWHYLMNPQYMNSGGSVEAPSFTLIARMDKMPPYLVTTESGEVKIRIFQHDSEILVKIKEFMAMYGIIDIKRRMLKIPELKMIMGFPKDYVLIGTQAEQKKYIGNAVEVTMARVICEATAIGLLEEEKMAI